jgi:hypothetical protein
LVSSLVPRDELLNAIGLQSSVFNFSKILRLSAGGLIIAYVGVAGCFLVNAISFVFLLFNLYMMELPPWEKRADEQTLWADVKEGFNYLLGNRRLLYIVGLSYVIATFCAPYNRFVLIFATNVLQVGASGFGLLMAAPGVGATVAALALASVKKTASGDQLDLLLRCRVRAVHRVVRLFPLFCFVVFLPGSGRLLPNRRARFVQYRDPNGNAASSARASAQPIFHGPWTVVAGQRDHRRRGRRHRYGLDLCRLRRDHRDRRCHAAERKPKIPR